MRFLETPNSTTLLVTEIKNNQCERNVLLISQTMIILCDKLGSLHMYVLFPAAQDDDHQPTNDTQAADTDADVQTDARAGIWIVRACIFQL